MPTEYTAKLYSGEEQSFEEFAIQCSRAFGAFSHMKDEPFYDNVPEMIPFDLSFHHERISHALQLFVDFQNKSDYAIEVKMRQEYEYSLEKLQATVQRKKAAQQRYEAMLAKVESWNPPTEDHKNIKEFMIQQLKDSLASDCSTEYEKREIQELQQNKETVEQYRARQTEILKKNLDFAKEQLDKEIHSIQEKNQWILDFRKSLRNN